MIAAEASETSPHLRLSKLSIVSWYRCSGVWLLTRPWQPTALRSAVRAVKADNGDMSVLRIDPTSVEDEEAVFTVRGVIMAFNLPPIVSRDQYVGLIHLRPKANGVLDCRLGHPGGDRCYQLTASVLRSSTAPPERW